MDESWLANEEMEEKVLNLGEEYPILQRLNMIPAALLTSEIEVNSDGSEIVNAPWQVVFLTSNDNTEFCSKFQTELRSPLNISTSDQEEIILSRENLPVIRCIPQTDCPPDLVMGAIEKNLRIVLGKILDRNGVIFVNNINDDYYAILSRIVIEYNHKKSLFILGKSENRNAKYLVEKHFAQELPSNCGELWDAYSSNDNYEESGLFEHVYCAGKMLKIPRRDLFKLSPFGELLTVEKAGTMQEIESGDIPGVFHVFLERSVSGFPAWYWYNPDMGFHIPRTIEKQFFSALLKAMEDADTKGDKAVPLLLYGQAYSGKTNILCSIAWQMFARNKYPVIYIPNAFSSSDIAEVTEKLAYLLKELEQHEISENNGIIVPTLIVWDLSCRQAGDLGMAREMLSDLRRAGRQVQMICSSYGYDPDMGKKLRSYWDRFKSFMVEPLLNDEELAKLIGILHKKGGFTDEEIRCCTKGNITKDPHFIATLYQFGELHDEIQKHIGNEMEGANILLGDIIGSLVEKSKKQGFNTMSLILEPIEKKLNFDVPEAEEKNPEMENFQKKMDNVMGCLAFCTFYGYAMPIELIVRLLGSEFPNPSEIYIAISNHPMLREQTDMDDNLQIKIRSSLEAKIIIDATNNRKGTDCRFDLLQILIDNLNFANKQEIDLIHKLIQSIGPNCRMMNRDPYCLWNSHRENFRRIWEKLQYLRKTKLAPCDANKLLPQELSLIREYYKREESSEEARNALLEAYRTAEEVLRNGNTTKDSNLEINILVEYCLLSDLLITQKISVNIPLTRERLYRENHERLYELGITTGNLYAQAILLSIGCSYYESLPANSCERMNLLAELFNYCSQFEETCDEFLKTRISQVYQKIDEFNCNDKLFEQGVTRGDPTGLYLKVIQEKRKIDTLPDYKDLETHKALANNILQKYFKEDVYQPLINRYYPLQELRIKLLWMSHTGWKIIPQSGEERLRPNVSESEWQEIFDYCSQYAQGRGNSLIDPRIRYLYILSALSLERYEMGNQLLNGFYTKISRRGNWYLICEASGIPRVFRGECYNKKDNERFGMLTNVRSVRFPGGMRFGRVKFLPENLRWSTHECKKGKATPEFWISVSFSGMEVVRPQEV